MGTLRIFLAFSVAYGHFAIPFSFPTIDIAVQSFFVVSGFYMALVLNEKYGPGSYWLFISNRLLRLWPAYFVVLILSLAVVDHWRSIAELRWFDIAFFAASQLLIVGQDLYLFLYVNGGHLSFTAHYTTVSTPLYIYAPVWPAWSLGPEIYFYLLAPILVRRGPKLITAIILASLTLRMTLQFVFGLSDTPWSFRFFPSEIALFLSGSLGYYVYAAKDAAQRRHVRATLAAVTVLLFACLSINRWDGISRLCSMSFLAAVVVGIPRLFELTRNLEFDRYLGELSYPLYICHFLFAFLLLPNTFTLVYLALALSLAMSVVLYHFVDRPIDRWRQSRLRNCKRMVLQPTAMGLALTKP